MDSNERTDGRSSTSNEIRFSVIVPTRDRPESLAQCLTALAQQRFPTDHFEVLVIDDGSAPPLAEFVDSRFGNLSIRLLRQKNAGPAAARNAGAKAAAHEYLAFTDDDCAPDPMWLASLAKAWPTDSDIMIGGAIENVLPNNAYSSASQELISYLYDYFNTPVPRFFCSNNLALSRKSFLSIGGFDTSFPLAAGEDRDFCDRWQFAGRPTSYISAAKVGHAHELDLRGYCRQHFRYGRAAAHFQKLFADRRRRPVRVEPPRFYARLIAYPFKTMPWHRAFACSTLLVLAQTINAAGFFYETRVRGRNHRSPD